MKGEFIHWSICNFTAFSLKGGVFNIETSEIFNDVLFIKETTMVNITFKIQNTNCSAVTFGEIKILKNDTAQGIFLPQCKIVPNCVYRPSYVNISCQCLGTTGSYSLSFIADRKQNAQWKWSAEREVQDAIITFNVTCK